MNEFNAICLNCGNTFVAKRSTARYCSNRCKQANKNKRYGKVRPETELSIIEDALRQLRKCHAEELANYSIEVERVLVQLDEFKARYMRIGDNVFLDRLQSD